MLPSSRHEGSFEAVLAQDTPEHDLPALGDVFGLLRASASVGNAESIRDFLSPFPLRDGQDRVRAVLHEIVHVDKRIGFVLGESIVGDEIAAAVRDRICDPPIS